MVIIRVTPDKEPFEVLCPYCKKEILTDEGSSCEPECTNISIPRDMILRFKIKELEAKIKSIEDKFQRISSSISSFNF